MRERQGKGPGPRQLKPRPRPPGDPRDGSARPRRIEDDAPPDEGWAVGRRAVREALDADRLEKLYVAPGADIGDLFGAARDKGIPVERTPREALSRLVGAHHQGVAGRVASQAYEDFDQFVEMVFAEKDPVILALDHLQDPRNIGAIARSAEAFGAKGMILPKRRTAGLSPWAQKASSGALVHLPVTRVSNIGLALDAFKKKGAWVVAADPDGDRELFEVDLKGPIVFVIGSEDEGVSRLLKERSDIRARISTPGKVASLNAAVAAGIFLYEMARQRKTSPSDPVTAKAPTTPS